MSGLRLALTGATGDFGKSILDWALGQGDVAEVTALGRRKTGVSHPKLREVFLDLSGQVDLEAITSYDALIHLAYCVEEPQDKQLAYQVNVTATKALALQANRAGVRHLVLTSSANALGTAACGTGRQFTEEDYPAGDADPGHYYFFHKALMEHVANWYWANAPEGGTKLAVVRPCYIVGERFDNSGLRTLLAKLVVYPAPARSFYQFLWDSDLVDAYATVLRRGLEGVYNIAPHDQTSVAEICAMTGARLVPVPLGLAKTASDVLFRARLTPFSGHWVTLGDPLIDSRKLRSQTDWRPSMSSKAALRQYCEARRAASP